MKKAAVRRLFYCQRCFPFVEPPKLGDHVAWHFLTRTGPIVGGLERAGGGSRQVHYRRARLARLCPLVASIQTFVSPTPQPLEVAKALAARHGLRR
jgi:hypothetical protein